MIELVKIISIVIGMFGSVLVAVHWVKVHIEKELMIEVDKRIARAMEERKKLVASNRERIQSHENRLSQLEEGHDE